TVCIASHIRLAAGSTLFPYTTLFRSWRSEDEQQHTVTVSGFYISPYEVSQEDYEALTGENPSTFDGNNLPVDSVSWLDAITYCKDRKSTRLNSSHVSISYAVFCLTKK